MLGRMGQGHEEERRCAWVWLENLNGVSQDRFEEASVGVKVPRGRYMYWRCIVISRGPGLSSPDRGPSLAPLISLSVCLPLKALKKSEVSEFQSFSCYKIPQIAFVKYYCSVALKGATMPLGCLPKPNCENCFLTFPRLNTCFVMCPVSECDTGLANRCRSLFKRHS